MTPLKERMDADRDRLAKEHEYSERCSQDSSDYFSASNSFSKGWHQCFETAMKLLLEESGEFAEPGQQISDVRHRLKRLKESSGPDLDPHVYFKIGDMDCEFLLGKIDQLQPIIQAQKVRIAELEEKELCK